jgi:hypothetical protein
MRGGKKPASSTGKKRNTRRARQESHTTGNRVAGRATTSTGLTPVGPLADLPANPYEHGAEDSRPWR